MELEEYTRSFKLNGAVVLIVIRVNSKGASQSVKEELLRLSKIQSKTFKLQISLRKKLFVEKKSVNCRASSGTALLIIKRV